MKWGAPEVLPWLWLLVPLAWGVLALVGRRERRLRELADEAVLSTLMPNRSASLVHGRTVVWLAAVALCGVAMARPQWGFHWQEVKRRGLDIMVVLDTSRSMLAEDIKPNRLQQAKWGIRDLVRSLKGDRVGLVSFAGSSFLQCPLTSDYAAFLMTMDDVYVGIIPRGGTAIGQALETALEGFEERTDADKVIVLVTDGEDHSGSLDAVTERLKQEGIRVYAVGVGSIEGDLIPDQTDGGPSGYFKNREGNVVKSALREDAIGRLALATGGIYVRSVPGDFGLDRIVEQGLANLKRDEQDSRMVKDYEERFVWPLGLALVLLGSEAALSDRRRRRNGEAA